MSPLMILARLALSVITNVCAVMLAAVMLGVYGDGGAAVACGLGLALVSMLVAPDPGHVQWLVTELKKQAEP